MNLDNLIVVLPGVILGLTVHEFMHAYTAKLFGDDTADKDGRISLNPLKHIDIMGFIFIVVAGFGWAKPVMISEEKFRRPRLASAVISVAGPFSNALLAIALTIAYVLLFPQQLDGVSRIQLVFLYGIIVNWGLFLFNMIPLPPLDGSHLVFHSFKKNAKLYSKIYRYGTGVLFGIIILERVLDVEILHIWPAIQWLASWGIKIAHAVTQF